MSSGEAVKPQMAPSDRNPFDVSRRSEQEVAAEIAARIVAWKQARGRSDLAATPAAAAKRPAVQAPAYPQHLPKFGERADVKRPAQEPERSVVSSGAAGQPAPFAPFAMLRAMPPAPSLRRPAPRTEPTIQTPDDEAPKIDAPRIEIAEWDMRPRVPAVRAPSRRRSGTGWAIVLGATLLILGVTSPAAIWRQWRVEALVILNQTDMTPAPRPAQSADRTARLENIDRLSAIADKKAEIPAMPTRLIAVPIGGELAAAPISVPQFPQPEAASTPAPAAKPHALPALSEHEVPPFPLLPRPFQPEWTSKPFRATPVEGASAPVVPKPSLGARMKPPVTAAPKVTYSTPQATAGKPATRKNDPQSLDQMFRNLIDTLATGHPTTPVPKPSDPSNRR